MGTLDLASAQHAQLRRLDRSFLPRETDYLSGFCTLGP